MKSTSAVAAIIQAVSPELAAAGAVDCACANHGHSRKPSATGTRIDRARIVSLLSVAHATLSIAGLLLEMNAGFYAAVTVALTESLPPEGQ